MLRTKLKIFSGSEKKSVVSKAVYSMEVLGTAVLELGRGLGRAFEVRGQLIFCEVLQMVSI